MIFSIKFLALFCSVAQVATATSVPGYECPPKSATCNLDNKHYTPDAPGAPGCWAQSYGKWTCCHKTNSQCPAKHADLKQCDYSPEKPRCPKPDDTCVANYRTFKANDPKAPKCWTNKGSKWECVTPSYGKKCDASKGQVDLKDCFIPPPQPECPKPSAKCLDASGNFWFLKDSNVPKCWMSDNFGGYLCLEPDSNGKCGLGRKDVSGCPKY